MGSGYQGRAGIYSVTCETSQCYMPEDGGINSHRCGNLTPHS